MNTLAVAERAPKKERRDVTINIRASAYIRDLIDSAASILGKTRSDFILETASERLKTFSWIKPSSLLITNNTPSS